MMALEASHFLPVSLVSAALTASLNQPKCLSLVKVMITTIHVNGMRKDLMGYGAVCWKEKQNSLKDMWRFQSMGLL